MPLGHGSIAEFAVASVRGGGVQNVGSPFISGSSFAASVGDETVTGDANMSVTNVVGTTALGNLSLVTNNIIAEKDTSKTNKALSELQAEFPYSELKATRINKALLAEIFKPNAKPKVKALKAQSA